MSEAEPLLLERRGVGVQEKQVNNNKHNIQMHPNVVIYILERDKSNFCDQMTTYY